MLLAIDVGNTNTVLALFNGDTLRAQWRISTQAGRTVDEYRIIIGQCFQSANIPQNDVSKALISCVVPQTLFALKQAVKEDYTDAIHTVSHTLPNLPIKIALENPAEIGADRLVNAVAAHALHRGDLIIIDFGTATTFDVISAAGVYEGGLIAPGILLSVDALHHAAAQLPHIQVRTPEKLVGTNTKSAMESGIFYGYLGLIEGIVKRLEEQRPESIVIATGGLAPLFMQSTTLIDHHEPDLIIKGLQIIAKNL